MNAIAKAIESEIMEINKKIENINGFLKILNLNYEQIITFNPANVIGKLKKQSTI